MKDIRISDVTMRVASASKQLTLSFKEKIEMAKHLDQLGVNVIEVEGIEHAKADHLRIKSIASIVKNSALAVPVKLDGSDIEAVWTAMAEASGKRLQVEAALSPARMEYVYHMKADKMLEQIASTVAACKQRCDDVEFIADDATRTDPAYLAQALQAAIEAGATTVTIGDLAGTMLADEFAQFITTLMGETEKLSDVSVGISCANELFMADACAIAGVIAGVDEVKACSYPLGLVSLHKFVKILNDKRQICQASCSVHTTALQRATAQIARICEQGKSDNPLFGAGSAMDNDDITLGVHDDRDAIAACVAKLGYDLGDEDLDLVYEAFLRIASKKDRVSGRELDAIVASAALQVPATYTLDRYVINSGNVIRATATIRMKRGEEVLEEVGIGDGPIDASFAAIEKIAGKRYELDDWQMQSVTQGQEAMGEAVVKLMADGKIYSGRGISTDIIGSSIRAYINALNKIVYEEEN